MRLYILIIAIVACTNRKEANVYYTELSDSTIMKFHYNSSRLEGIAKVYDKNTLTLIEETDYVCQREKEW